MDVAIVADTHCPCGQHGPPDRPPRGRVRLLNPGSATGAAPASRTTMYTATVADGDVDVALHEA